MGSWVGLSRRVLGAGLCCAGLVLAGVLGTTDGSPMPPIPAARMTTADNPLPNCDPCPFASSGLGPVRAAGAGPVL
jgi:hypothetical protein